MDLHIAISLPTALACIATVGFLSWAGWVSASEPAGTYFPNLAPLFYFGFALIGVLFVWLVRACVSIWLGV